MQKRGSLIQTVWSPSPGRCADHTQCQGICHLQIHTTYGAAYAFGMQRRYMRGLILSQISLKNSFPITQARRNSRGSFLLAYLYRYTPVTNKKTGLWLGAAEGVEQINETSHTSFSGWVLLAEGAFFIGLAKINEIGKNTFSEEMRSSEQWKQGNTCSWSPRARLWRVFLCLQSLWSRFFAPSFSFYSLFTFLHGSRSYRFWVQDR